MTALAAITDAILDTGYRPEAVVSDYAFADVLSERPVTRRAPLVAFTRTPPSYRSAALGVLEHDGRDVLDLIREYRALGAPFLLVIEGETVTVWQVRSDGPPRALESVDLDGIADLFGRHREAWHPDTIHRAKSLGKPPEPYQVDFIDLGLLPAIEGEIHIKLDRLLVESLKLARAASVGAIDPRMMFRIVFRLLAAKVLEDRGHPFSLEWQANDLSSVLTTIERYYGLRSVDVSQDHEIVAQFAPAWHHLRAGISFSNVSSDDLAFLYENTLITDETRDLFGTHSTPRQLAEYIVRRLHLHEHRPEDLSIYEPCAGAGVFLVSALRHLRDLLPDNWSDEARHAFLIDHISGDEIDPFACEVATLSLILADYPNHNGWHIKEVDLLDDGVLAKRMVNHNVILCNPPFEAFTANEKTRYPEASRKVSKAIAVLSAAIDAKPLALGFVLPRAFIIEKQFAAQRRRLEAIYGSIEIVELPDRIFGVSQVESSAVIAKHPRSDEDQRLHLISTQVEDHDRLPFLAHGHVSASRSEERAVADAPTGDLWLPTLAAVWDYLRDAPVLSTKLQPRWGLRWNYAQDLASRETPAEGYLPGLLKVKAFRQYVGRPTVFLDFQIEHLREGYNQDWSKPKIIMNAMRLRRGPWRVGAMVDFAGLLYSQQFFGLWPVAQIDEDELYSLCAVLNGPVANAYLAVMAPRDRFRSTVVGRVPLPRTLPAELPSLVRQYLALVRDDNLVFDRDRRLAELLGKIDAVTVAAYNLPPNLRCDLEDFFAGASRPVAHSWSTADHGDSDPSAKEASLDRELERLSKASAAVHQRFIERVATLRSDELEGEAFGGTASLTKWRADGKLFSVHENGHEYYPLFQFEDHHPRPVIASVLELLGKSLSDWEIALWFVSANAWLGGAAPVEFMSDPTLIAYAAGETSAEMIG